MIKKLFFLLLFCNFSFAQVVINELDADTEGTDALEFIELKSTIPNFSLEGYVLVFFNAGGTTPNTAYMSFDLDDYVTDINGIVTLGNDAVSPIPDKHLVNNVIQNGPDAVAIYVGNPSNFTNGATLATTANLVDALVHKTNDANPTSLMAALGVNAAYDEFINVSSPSDVNSIQRKNDGSYETKAPTPDVPNDGSGTFNYLRTTITPTGNKTEGTSFTINFILDDNVNSGTLTFNYTLANGTFTTTDYTADLSVSIPAGSNSATRVVNLTDDNTDEGDETLLIKIGTLSSSAFSVYNNIEVRIHDNDYIVKPWGVPTSPTYGLCPKDIPAGYYDSLNGKSGAQLKQAIKDIIANPLEVRYHTYGDVWEILKEADTDPRNSSNVWLMYVEHESSKLNQQTSTSGAIDHWNREHIFCQSRGVFDKDKPLDNTIDGINAYTLSNSSDIYAGGSDAYHLRAEDSPENSSRNNRNYGVDYNGPNGTAGSWKGDVARACFYMACRYDGLDVENGDVAEGTGKIGDLTTLLAWNKSDNSDDFEVNRNNVIYNWQRNRNPFVDYPLLADYVFGDKVGQTWNASLSNQDFNKLDVVMFPNPTNGMIQIAGLQNTADIEIYTVTGQKVFQSKYEINARLDLNLATGVYMIKIAEGEKSTTKKLIIK